MSSPTTEIDGRPLWFEPFLQQLKKQLGYPLDLSKFAQLLSWANSNEWSTDHSFNRLYSVCRLLFLQNPEHEVKFTEVFCEYIIDELDHERNKTTIKIVTEKSLTTDDPEITTTKAVAEKEKEIAKKIIPAKEGFSEEPMDNKSISKPATIKKFLNLSIPQSDEKEINNIINSPGGSRFLLTDAYLPLTTREMIHGWRHLRKRMHYRQSNRLDVFGTVQHIAKQGMLLQPVFEREQINSDNLLLILADRRGSMVPFHKLIDKLIETAVKGGGHRKAMVYYFYNCPDNFVYKNSNLTDPIKLTQLYSMIRADHTNALIISDAGAARGNMNEMRVEKTRKFLCGEEDAVNSLNGLHKTALFVAWLNPMPRHRWQNSTAEAIEKKCDTPMYPLMEDGYRNFLHVIEKLMGR